MTDAFVGGAMSPEEEDTHRRAQAEQLADEADAAIETIEAKIAGMKVTLAAKKAEAKEHRANARKKGDQ